ncbi:unnamed protein product, partial [Amoebophrya sp. A120]
GNAFQNQKSGRWKIKGPVLGHLLRITNPTSSGNPNKTPRFVLQNPHPDSGVGTFLLRI